MYEALDNAKKARADQAVQLTQAEILQIETAAKLRETEAKMNEAAAESKFLVEELSAQLEKKAMEVHKAMNHCVLRCRGSFVALFAITATNAQYRRR